MYNNLQYLHIVVDYMCAAGECEYVGHVMWHGVRQLIFIGTIVLRHCLHCWYAVGVNTIVMFARESNKALSGSGSGYFPHSAGGYIVRSATRSEPVRKTEIAREPENERGHSYVCVPAYTSKHRQTRKFNVPHSVSV